MSSIRMPDTRQPAAPPRTCPQRGTSLIVCLLMLLAIALLGASAAHIAVQSEKASRADDDRQLAMLAAEEALRDAQADIDASPRSPLFGAKEPEGFIAGCGRGLGNPYLGLCKAAPGLPPAWHAIGDAQPQAAVPYGHFTRRGAGAAAASASASRYLIEWMPQPRVSGTHAYRITAIGFGRSESTQVVLQALVTKDAAPSVRTGWREILNWKEIRDE